MAGTVDQFVQIQPNRLTLIGPAGTLVKEQTTITPLPKYPFRILSYRTQRDGNIRAKLESDPSGAFHTLRVENIVMEKGRFVDVVLLKTDSTIKPEIRIPVYGILR